MHPVQLAAHPGPRDHASKRISYALAARLIAASVSEGLSAEMPVDLNGV